MQESPLTSHFPAVTDVNLQLDFIPSRGQITSFLSILENFTSSRAVASLWRIELIAVLKWFLFFYFYNQQSPSLVSRLSCLNLKKKIKKKLTDVTECKNNPLQTMQLYCEACEFFGCSNYPDGFVISHYSLIQIFVSSSARRKLLLQLEPNSCHVWLLCLGRV